MPRQAVGAVRVLAFRLSYLALFQSTLFPVVLPVLIGGALTLFGVMISNSNSRKLLKIQLENQQEKDRITGVKHNAEELFSLFSTQEYLVSSKIVTLMSVMEGKLSYNQYLDLIIEDARSNKFDAPRIELIAKAYFPDTIPFYDEVQKSYSEISLIVQRHKVSYQKNGSGSEFLPLIQDASSKFSKRAEKFKEVIIEELQKS